jgi:hypothetical protein
LEDLKLDHLYVYYPGSQRYALSESVTVEPLAVLAGNEAPGSISSSIGFIT